MKIGRNAPCPCGSGKKYKKCCLKKTVTPPETLSYRRLSKALDKLMPRLIEHGLSVYGEMGDGMALAEFFGWPDPGEVPDDETAERAGMLYWPWFVFNWEYESLDDEDGILDGPEGATIAELYVESKAIDPQSLEGKLIYAANRNPYSFIEILSVKPGQSVQLRDVLTGTEMNVQDKLGSEILKRGDILYGRAILVDGVGMFLGLSAIVLPPRMKPQLIDLRRNLSRGRKKVTRDELYDWDLDIRELYLEMDRALHTRPELRNTDGDPMEFHKLIYNIESTDIAVEKLAPLCMTETIKEIRAAAEKDKNGNIHRAAFDWNRKGSPINKGMPNTVLAHIEIDGSQMTVIVNSVQRAKKIRKEIEKRLGTAARLRLDEISDLDAMMEGGDGPPLPDTGLMDHPEIQQHIGQMLQTHWDNWVDQKIPALGNKTPKQVVRTADGREAVEALLLDAEKMADNDPIRSSIEKEFIAEVRRRLKLDRPLRKKTGTTDPGQLTERIAQIKTLIAEFGDKRLHDTYTGFAMSLCDAVAASNRLIIYRGRTDIWAAAIVYAIAQLNFLFSRETTHHLTPEELCNWFKVKQSTVSSKAATIRTTLDLFFDDERFCAPHVTRSFQYLEDENGFIFPATLLEPEGDHMPEPIPLKPPPETEKGKTQKPVKPKKSAKKGDDRQLSLFQD